MHSIPKAVTKNEYTTRQTHTDIWQLHVCIRCFGYWWLS